MELGLTDAERAFRAEMAYYRAHHYEGRDPDTLAELRDRCTQALRAELPTAVAGAISLPELTSAMLESLRFAAYPDALAVLPALRARGLKLVAVSNWDVSLPAVLRATGLAGLLANAQSAVSERRIDRSAEPPRANQKKKTFPVM